MASPDPPDDDEVSVSSEDEEESASRYSFAPSTDARRGAADGGHRYVFWLASNTLPLAAGVPAAPDRFFFFSGVATGTATGDADLALLVSKE